jgi:hypothetical protein
MSEEEAAVVVGFLNVLCAACTVETPHDLKSIDSANGFAEYLTGREAASMVLHLASSHHHLLLDRALQLGVLLLRAEVGQEDAHRQCHHSFELAFRGHEGRKALASFHHIFEEHRKRLLTREHEVEEDEEALDMSEENLEVDVVRAVLQMVEQLSMDSNAAMQHLFRHQDNELDQVNMLADICGLSDAYGRLTQHKMRHGFVIS